MLCNAQNSRRKTMLAVSYLLSTAVSNPVTTTRQHDRLAIVSIDLRQTACLHHCTDTQECLRDPKVGERGACGVYQNIYASAAVEKWSTRAGHSAEIYAYTTRIRRVHISADAPGHDGSPTLDRTVRTAAHGPRGPRSPGGLPHRWSFVCEEIEPPN